jgi:hypothetical protein
MIIQIHQQPKINSMQKIISLFICTVSCLIVNAQISVVGNGLTASGPGNNTVSLGGTLTAPTTLDFGSGYTSNFLLKKGSSNYFSVSNDGKVGIGTASPTDGQLHLYQNSTNGFALKIENGDAAGSYPYIAIAQMGSSGWGVNGWANAGFIEGSAAGGLVMSALAGDLKLQTQRYTRMTILNSNGYVGIGNTNPSYNLDVSGIVNIDPGAGTGTIMRLRLNNGYGTYYADASSDLHFAGRFHVDQTLYPDGGLQFNTPGAGIVLNYGPISGVTNLSFNYSTSNLKMFHDYNAYAPPADQGIIMKYSNRASGGYPRAAYQVYKEGDPTENPFLISSQGFGWLKNSKADEVAWIIKAASSQTANLQEWQNNSGSVLTVINSAGSVGIGTSTPNTNAKLDVSGNIFSSGKIAIGTTDMAKISTYSLAVNGDAIFNKVKVKLYGVWPDYVFHRTYPLLPLSEVEKFIQQNNHLPEVPSAKEVEENGLDLGDNQTILVKKIEELTLYLIEQNKKIEEQQQQIKSLQSQQNILKTLQEELEKVKLQVAGKK